MGAGFHAHAVPHMQAAAQAGDTRPPGLDEVVALHFVAIVQREGRLLELDGRKPFPIDHGASSPDALLQVCRQLQTLNKEKHARMHIVSVDSAVSLIPLCSRACMSTLQ